jgi:hypothetical protein
VLIWESVANSVTVTVGGTPETLKIRLPCVTKTSRGVNPAFADWAGAIVMYFSLQVPPPGIVAKNVTFPKQSIFWIFWLQYRLAITSVVEAATPMGALAMAKGCGLAAG